MNKYLRTLQKVITNQMLDPPQTFTLICSSHLRQSRFFGPKYSPKIPWHNRSSLLWTIFIGSKDMWGVQQTQNPWLAKINAAIQIRRVFTEIQNIQIKGCNNVYICAMNSKYRHHFSSNTCICELKICSILHWNNFFNEDKSALK